MLEFPRLKTGEAAQYPLARTVEQAVRVLPFLDGTAQRYALRRPRRRWTVELRQLDETEAARVDDFLRGYMETFEEFAFTDPADGVRYERCRLELGEDGVQADGAARCGTRLRVVEVLG